MLSCGFLGATDIVDEKKLRIKLYEVLTDLVENQGVEFFYVGEFGPFQKVLHPILSRLCNVYPHIHCCVVLAYSPLVIDTFDDVINLHTIYPDEIEEFSIEFAEVRRNLWLLDNCDVIVIYSENDVEITNRKVINVY